MQLAEHPGEGGLAALVRPRHHKQTFGAGETKIVADDGALLRDQLRGKCEVEAPRHLRVLVGRGYVRVAERQTCSPERLDEREVSDEEPDLAVECRDDRIDEVRVARDIVLELSELLGEQPPDKVKDALLDMVERKIIFSRGGGDGVASPCLNLAKRSRIVTV